MDLFKKIKDEHVFILSTLDELIGSDPRTKKETMNSLSMQILVHMDAEERTIYAALEDIDPIARSVALRDEVEHDLGRYLINRLRERGTDIENWNANLQVLHKVLRDHMEAEEGILFDLAMDHFDDDEIKAMTERFVNVENTMFKENQTISGRRM